MRFLFVRPEVCPWVSRFPTSGFLQIPPRDGHPCLRLYPSHYRADLGLAPLRNVRRQAHQESRRLSLHGLNRLYKKTGVHSFTCSSLTVYTFPSFFCVSCGYPLLLSNSIHAKHTLSYPTVYIKKQNLRAVQQCPCQRKSLPHTGRISRQFSVFRFCQL